MDKKNWVKVETIVDQVLELPKEDWQTFIEKKCRNAPQLKDEVTLLLDSILDSEGWLEDKLDFKSNFYDGLSKYDDKPYAEQSLIGKKIGAYTIKEKIGEGGMGTVYRADRSDEEFEHEVAIKIIRHSRATPDNIRRFRHEQNILAGLHHPGIARLYDGGMTDDGSPYIIMEYISGLPIDQYCRKDNCSLNERIRLFKQVLEALRYAHQNLIIHRDLKPDNILVDDSKNIKILDFGISKLLESEDEHRLTRTGSRLLTPRYAAPEQVKDENITTATDLYTLGIILYELLTGMHPLPLNEKSRHEVEQIILNHSPARPSSAISSPDRKKQLRGDLDAIILKAIRKDPNDRYRDITELLDDLLNYQHNLPVNARKGSNLYQVAKFYKRNKKGLTVATGVLVLIAVITGFYTWRVTQERNQAEMEAQKAEEVKSFLVDIFASSNPAGKEYKGNEISAQDLLTAGIERADTELSERPQIYIELLFSIGDALYNLNAHNEAEKALKKALAKSKAYYGANHVETASILSVLARAVLTVSHEDAEQYILDALAIVEKKENQYLNQAKYYSILAGIKARQSDFKEAEQLYLKADSLYMEADEADSPSRYASLDNLGEAQVRLAKYEAAENNLQKALAFYQDYYSGPHTNLASTQYSLGHLYSQMGDYIKSNQLLLKAADTGIQLTGPTSASLINYYGSLALNYIRLNQLDKAQKYATDALNIAEIVYGKDSIAYSHRLNTMGLIYLEKEQYDEAIKYYLEAIDIKEKLLKPNNTSLAVAYFNYAAVLQDLGELHKAKQYFEKALEIDRHSLGADNPDVAIDMNRLATVLTELGDYQQAASLFEKAQKIYEKKLPENHFRRGENLLEQARLAIEQGKFDQARQQLNAAKTIYLHNFDLDHNKVKEIEQLQKKVRESS